MEEVVQVTGAGGREGGLQPWASGREVGLRSALIKMESVLAEVQGKEIHSVELLNYLRKASRKAVQAEDLLSELEYYRIKEKLERDDEAAQDTTKSSFPADLQIVPYVSNPVVNYLREVYRKKAQAKDLLSELDYYRVEEEMEQDDEAAQDTIEISSPADVQIVPYVSKPMVSAGTIPVTHLGILKEIDEHTKACRSMTKYLHDALQIENLVDRIHTVKESQSTGGNDPRETSSSPTQPKVYGRDQEQQLIISKLTSQESAGEKLSVLAIIGHGGVGKTTLSNVAYNDPAVSKYFHIRLWVYVSVYFDQAKVMHNMLEQLIGDKHQNLKSLQELQDNLAYVVKSKKVLLVLDDLWEDTQEEKWRDLISPLLSNEVQGNKILVTTRKPSVAKFARATDHINLDGLKRDDFWKLFNECVFGDENYKRQPRLQDVGRKIVVQLKGNPLAAKSVGKVLRRNLKFESWTRILNDSEWKHEADDYDIMPALMISYKYLPDDLKPCFSYCALFPKYHMYEKERLVDMWIALGFICSTNIPRRLEDIGSELFNDLVEWGFLEKYLGYGSLHMMHDLICDLAQKVSSHENFSIVENESRKAPQLVRHVSIITEYQYKALDGIVGHNEDFLQGFSSLFSELQNEKLSTLMLFGAHHLDFANTFRQKLTEVKSVRVLKLEMAVFDLDSMIGNISAFVNLRYLELGCSYEGSRLELPEDICKLYHLQVLDIKKNWGPRTVLPRGMNKLVNLRHFIAVEEVLATVPEIGKMVSLQELKSFAVRRVSEFSISQLKRLNQLRGSLSIYNLNNVGSQQEAIEASICDKIHLTTLQLSWYDVSGNKDGTSSVPPILEYLKPHAGLLNLTIVGYKRPIPSWLSNNVHLTSLRSLHLNDCSKWRSIPQPDQLPLLRELHLVSMVGLVKIEIGCLEILKLCNLQRLTQCTVVDKEQFSVNLRDLEVERCEQLKGFPTELFIPNDLQSKSQFTRLHRLHAFMNRTNFGHTSISQLLLIDSLTAINLSQHDPEEFCLEYVSQLNGLRMKIKGRSKSVSEIDGRFFQFGKLRGLVELEIRNYPKLASLPWEGFQQLASLKKLQMFECRKLFSGNVDLSLPPSVEELEFCSCNIKGIQVSQLLRNLTSLKNLTLTNCEEVTSLPVGLFADEPNQLAAGAWFIPPNCVSTLESMEISFRAASSMMHFASDKGHFGRFVSLKKLVIRDCPTFISSMISGVASDIPRSFLVKLHVHRTKDSFLQFSEFSSLVELFVSGCPVLTCVNLDSCTTLQELEIHGCESLLSLEGLQSCQALRKLSIQSCEVFSSLSVSLNTLTELTIERNPNLEDMNLYSCMALQKLRIADCIEMSCEGLKSLVGLQDLEVKKSPGFTMSWLSAAAKDDNRKQNYFPRALQVLDTDDIRFLCMPICSELSSLKKLTIHGDDEPPLGRLNVLTDDNEKALLRLNSLKELSFNRVQHLTSLPAELHYLTSLERLILDKCPSITCLPIGGLPASLNEMHVNYCSEQLEDTCRNMPRSRKPHFYVVE